MFINYDSDITALGVHSTVRLQSNPKGVAILRQNRERWAIALKKEGKTYYTSCGETILSDKNHPVILPKGCSYSWECVKGGECIILEFEASEEYENILAFEIADSTPFVKVFEKIEKLKNLKGENHSVECNYLLYSALFFLINSAKKEYTPKDRKEILQPATEYIAAKYYDSSITNDSLAELCKISTVHFRKTFEKVYGISPIRYLNNFRIEKAKSMLCSDFESINQVAQSVGYNSIYHFSKMFKIYTGVSPAKYKR